MITVVLAVVGVGVGAANASTTSSQDCVMVVGKGATPDAVSPVLYQYCSTASMAAARQHLMSSQVRDQLGSNAVNSSDLLMTWWSDNNFEGANTTNIFGASGPCDTAGYRVQPNAFWQTHLSSIAGTAQCTHVDLTTRSLTFADDFRLPAAGIGPTLNDNVGLTHVYML
jgi:hypothetical protein